MSIRVLHFGLGPIGCGVARQTANRSGLEIVGGVDVAPDKAGRDIGEIIGLNRALGVAVSPDLASALQAAQPDVAVLCTSSSLARVLPQIEAVLEAGLPIVSTTEELAYPVGDNIQLARRIDEAAKANGVAVLGTGVNPGFLMDALPIMLTGVCERVDKIEVERVQDARTRRLPFQQKIGAGLTAEEFAQRVANGSVRHVGLAESVSMIADAMGWKLDRISDEIAPKLAVEDVASEWLSVGAGRVCGLVQDGIGWRNGEAIIALHMEAYLGAPESFDAVRVHGSPPLSMKLAGGVQGDVATASIVVNSLPKVLAAPPGLHTMRSLPLPSFFGNGSMKLLAEQ